MPPRIFKDKTCKQCGEKFNRKIYGKELEPKKCYVKRMFCEAQCYWDYNTGKRHYKYVPGGILNPITGYLRTTDPDTGRRRAHLHRIKMEKKLGRRLKPGEHVHHKDGDKLNNRLSNLQLLTAREHGLTHAPNKKRKKNGHYA
jgi:hypothetical protein